MSARAPLLLMSLVVHNFLVPESCESKNHPLCSDIPGELPGGQSGNSGQSGATLGTGLEAEGAARLLPALDIVGHPYR